MAKGLIDSKAGSGSPCLVLLLLLQSAKSDRKYTGCESNVDNAAALRSKVT